MSEQNNKAVISIISLSLVALAWGTSYAIIKDALNNIKPFALMTMRFSFSTILLSIIFFKRLKKIKKIHLYHGAIIGIFMFLSFLTLVTGIALTTASKQAFIVGSYVLIVPFLAWVINRKKPDIYAVIGAVLSTIGLALLTINGDMPINRGDLISLLCALFFSCHMICIERFSRESDPINLTIIQFAVTSVLFIICTAAFESLSFNIPKSTAVSMTYLVFVATVVAFVVQNVAQKYISATSTALILTLESAFGSVFAVFLLHETMTKQMVLGCIIILLGIITQETKWKFLRKKDCAPALN